MTRFIKDRSKSHGAAPGSLIFVGEKKLDNTIIKLMEYCGADIEEKELAGIEEIADPNKEGKVTWINIYGLHETSVFEKIKHILDVSALTMEDILNTDQRPKFEEFDNYIFIVMKMLVYNSEQKRIDVEQISFIMAENYLFTFQERKGDFFNPVRERLRNSKGRIRKFGADYLAYALMDTIVDNYHHVISSIGERVEDLEEKLLDNPDDNILHEINLLKKDLIHLRKAIKPTQQMVLELNRSESDLIKADTSPFLSDLLDLTMQASEALESYRELISDQLNIYHTSIGNKLNDIMKVLTIFSATFIPLTFLAGIYGTNFSYLPELQYKASYFIFWGVLILVGSGMLYYFKRKGWIGRKKS